MVRQLSTRGLIVDVTLAGFCVLLRLALGIGEWQLYLVLLAMGAALALRRLRPGLALLIAWVGALFQVFSGQQPDVCNLAIIAVLYTTARYGTNRVKWAGLISGGLGAVVVASYFLVTSLPPELECGPPFSAACLNEQLPAYIQSFSLRFLSALTAFVLSWTLGLLARTWRESLDSRQARLAAEEQRTRAQQDVIVEQERNQIARDMHDVVAHSLAVVIAQADGARYARTAERPNRSPLPDSAATAPAGTTTDVAADPVDAALTTIAQTAREALADVRVLLGQLRHHQGSEPQPALGDLDRLLDQFRDSGLPITHNTVGTPLPLASAQQLAVYRIIQESLTNALRHGRPGSPVTLTLSWSEQAVHLHISNELGDAPPAPATEVGHGLVGMRERALLVGGWLTASPEAGRFVVSASIPAVSA